MSKKPYDNPKASIESAEPSLRPSHLFSVVCLDKNSPNGIATYFMASQPTPPDVPPEIYKAFFRTS